MGTKALYQAANVWKTFGTITEYSPSGIEHTTAQTIKAYAANGILYISNLCPGIPLGIYNLAGQLVYEGIAKTEAEQIPLNVRGIYIIMAGSQTIKTIVE